MNDSELTALAATVDRALLDVDLRVVAPRGADRPVDRGVVTAAVARQPAAWPQHAACRGADPELFGPHDLRRREQLDLATLAARRYCAHCPVLNECGAEADRDDLQGVWGGVHRTRNTRVAGVVRDPLITHHTPTRKASR